MVDEPVTDRFELEYRLLYSALVAGKSARFAEKALGRFLYVTLDSYSADESPFQIVSRMIAGDVLEACLRRARTGSYRRLGRCFGELLELDPATCTVADLEGVHGIGPKTARFFLLWTRPGVRLAALDVHVLRWLRCQGWDAPRSTPQSGKRYAELERAFLCEANARGKTPRELDLEIWESGSSGVPRPQLAMDLEAPEGGQVS